MLACNQSPESQNGAEGNPFFNELNEPVLYGEVTHEDITAYGDITLMEIETVLERIRSLESPDFENVFVAFDNVINDLSKASSSCFMFYWVSPDSMSRDKGLEAYMRLDSLSSSLTSDAGIYRQMQAFAQTDEYMSTGRPPQTTG